MSTFAASKLGVPVAVIVAGTVHLRLSFIFKPMCQVDCSGRRLGAILQGVDAPSESHARQTQGGEGAHGQQNDPAPRLRAEGVLRRPQDFHSSGAARSILATSGELKQRCVARLRHVKAQPQQLSEMPAPSPTYGPCWRRLGLFPAVMASHPASSGGPKRILQGCCMVLSVSGLAGKSCRGLKSFAPGLLCPFRS